MIVIVLIFVGAFMGPTLRCGASGFFWMKLVWFANPLYVPSGCPSVLVVFDRAEPSRFFADSSSLPSSYQLLCFVASLTLVMGTLRSAVYTVAERSFPAADEPASLEEAVTTAFFLRRLTRWPDSSSEEE